METEGVAAEIFSAEGALLFSGAAVLRERSHPLDGRPRLHLGVPDDALAFRPVNGERYRVRIERPDATEEVYATNGAWLERVGSSWWFVLEDGR